MGFGLHGRISVIWTAGLSCVYQPLELSLQDETDASDSGRFEPTAIALSTSHAPFLQVGSYIYADQVPRTFRKQRQSASPQSGICPVILDRYARLGLGSRLTQQNPRTLNTRCLRHFQC